MADILNVLQNYIDGLTLGDKAPIAVACSGGPDSLALAHMLKEGYATPERTLHIISVDHALRADSQAEQASLSCIAQFWNYVKFKSLTWDHEENVDSRVQEEARAARYTLMAQYCKAEGINHLFLGHHMDDQAETFLFRLAKGSGLDGLGGMKPVQTYNESLSLCRPFLELPKADLISYCEEYNLPYISDPSNENTDFARVRLRESRAVLEGEGLSSKRLSVTATRLQKSRTALDWSIEQLIEKALSYKDSRRIEYNLELLIDVPEDLMTRLVLKGITELGAEKHYGPRLEKVESLSQDLIKAIQNRADFRKRTLAGVIFNVDQKDNKVVFEAENP